MKDEAEKIRKENQVNKYCKDTEPFISFFYVLTGITLLSGVYPLPAMHSLLVKSDIINI